MSKERKLIRTIAGAVVTMKEVMTGKEIVCDFSLLNAEIQAKLGPFGLSHKLGDSAAGAVGQDAVDSITKTWEGLVAGNWRVAGERGASVSVNAVNAGIEKLPAGEQKLARQLMLKLKVIKPVTKDDYVYLMDIGAMSAEEGAKAIAALPAE